MAGVRSWFTPRLSVADAAARTSARELTPQRLEGHLRIGYVVWDWPALSQTFVLNEIRQLISLGHDVVVYYYEDAEQPTTPDFEVVAHQVSNVAELTTRLVDDARQVMHCPFAYPGTTKLVWPAAKKTGIPFTFMAGGVDVAAYVNIERNKVGKVASSKHCLGVITLGTFHRDLLIECGVPSTRIVMERQSAALPDYAGCGGRNPRPVAIAIGRFIEKKGFEYLVRAAALLPEVDIRLYGYGPLEDDLRRVAAEVGATNVEFAGIIEGPEELEDTYRQADLFVLPCVRAADGDLDGLPTVLLEAMGAGVPVVTTDAANIPDLVTDAITGFLCSQRDVPALVAAVRRALAMTPQRRTALVRAARRQAEAYANPERTVQTLLRLWRRDALDIVLVTYDRKGYRSKADTFAIIDRILALTSLPFSLTVVDNASDRRFLAELEAKLEAVPNASVLALDDNILCGPASNIGFAQGRAPYLVYICSNEGYLLRNGWDHQMVRTMERTGAAMAGHAVELAKHRNGLELQAYPSFADFRAKEFAIDNPARPFRHVQGGLFILRRDVFEQTGGFSPAVPHNGMDVEFSHYVESLGHTLASVPGVVAITTKTRPALPTLVDEFTVAVHPAGVGNVGQLDALVARSLRSCPVCAWTGAAFEVVDGVDRCPRCSSSPFSRSALRLLSQSGGLQTRPRARVITREASLARGLAGICPDLEMLVTQNPVEAAALVRDASRGDRMLVVVDRYWPDPASFAVMAAHLVAVGGRGGVAVAGAPGGADDSWRDPLDALATEAGTTAVALDLTSGMCSFDPYPTLVVGAPLDPASLQGIEC